LPSLPLLLSLAFPSFLRPSIFAESTFAELMSVFVPPLISRIGFGIGSGMVCLRNELICRSGRGFEYGKLRSRDELICRMGRAFESGKPRLRKELICR
jgi:hypothetical protein